MGGAGNDVIVGGFGVDQLVGGAGDDQFQWNPGDSSDVIEGQEDDDILMFNGSNIGEIVDLSADNGRLRFFRNVANINLDCAGIERVSFRALGGADQVVVNDLAGTEVAHVIVDLLAFSGLGDAQADVVMVNGTATNDVIKVYGSTNGMLVVMSTADVTVLGAENDLDVLRVNGLAGDDELDASAVEMGAMPLTLDGGLGTDT